jgi:hypothetical protein
MDGEGDFGINSVKRERDKFGYNSRIKEVLYNL